MGGSSKRLKTLPANRMRELGLQPYVWSGQADETRTIMADVWVSCQHRIHSSFGLNAASRKCTSDSSRHVPKIQSDRRLTSSQIHFISLSLWFVGLVTDE